MPDAEFTGHATEAARTLLGYLFQDRGKHRVTACCDARNAASERDLQRLPVMLPPDNPHGSRADLIQEGGRPG